MSLQTKVRGMKMPAIDVWKNHYADKDYWITMEVLEFTCVCPKTGLPDFAAFTIKYRPDRYCIELKSFKLYLTAYRDIGIFHEHVTNKILDDFVHACKPRHVQITGTFHVRGGIRTSVSAEYINV